MTSCFQLGDSLEVDAFGDLQVKLATDSGLEIIPGVGGGLSLQDDQLSPEWQSHTPILYAGGVAWTQGNGTATGRYIYSGELVTYAFDISFGTTSSIGTGILKVSLPVPADTATFSTNVRWGSCQAVNSGVANSSGPLIITGTSEAGLFFDYYGSTLQSAPTTTMTHNSPFSPAVGDHYAGFMSYKVA